LQECTPDYRALPSGNYSAEIRCVCCFDLLELNDKDLRLLPLVAGKQKLGVLVLLGALKEHDIADPSFVDELNSSGFIERFRLTFALRISTDFVERLEGPLWVT
jgi:hypothetical protein